MFATTTTTTTTTRVAARAHCASRSTSSTRATSAHRATAAAVSRGGVRLGTSRQSAIARGGAVIGGATPARATTRANGRRAVVTCVTRDATANANASR